IMLAQLARQQSNKCLKFAVVNGLALWSSGASRKTIEMMAAARLCISYTAISAMVNSLAAHCVRLAALVALGPHMLGYDNINISLSTFIEQRGLLDTPYKVQSGTFGLIYELRGDDPATPINPAHLDASGLIKRFMMAPSLDYKHDVQLTAAQTSILKADLQATIIEALFRLFPDMFADELKNNDQLKRPVVLEYPHGLKTAFYATRASTIEEATRAGNSKYLDELYRLEFGMTPSQLRREVFQVALALFHLVLNLIWAVHVKHQATVATTGSLSWFYALLEKSRLANPHPDYHSLLMALRQTLDALLIDSWRKILARNGYSSVTAFAKSNPTAEIMKELADQLHNSFASTVP
ncbi:hypothetical protein CONPUDRAFT_34928, partial [Coniophora puteana RWD-64-598 SS2]